MIVVDLVCEHDHRFEGWFACSEDIETQQKQGLLICAICGSREMRRLPSAPHVQRHAGDEAQHERENVAVDAVTTEAPPTALDDGRQLLQLLVKKLQESAERAEDVGEDFPVEARRIHFGDAEDRPIRGFATSKDVASLLDEGISVLPVPVAKEDLH